MSWGKVAERKSASAISSMFQKRPKCPVKPEIFPLLSSDMFRYFPDEAVEGFRDPTHPRYSPKLACAVAAWEAIERPKSTKSVKATITEWVAANGTRFGMAEGDGVPSATGVDEVAKVANWDTKGGANRTGGQAEETSPPVVSEPIENFAEAGRMPRRPSKNAPAFEPGGIDDDIPF